MDKQNTLDQLFKIAKNEPVKYSFDDTRLSFIDGIGTVKSFKSPSKKSIFTLKNWIIMISSIGILTLVFIGITSNEAPQKDKSTVVATVQQKHLTEEKQEEKMDKTSSVPKIANISPQKPKAQTFLFKLPKKEEVFSELVDKVKKEVVIAKVEKKEFNFSDESPLPKLSEEEIKMNNKQKKVMLKALEKFDKKSYAILASGSFDFNGKMTSVQSFLIQKTEVSNLEYRTFLFDMLIQGRNDDFLRARPDYKQWSILQNQKNSPYEQHYFSHPAYDNFPVVNISREGAEMYCVWLTQELYKGIDLKKENKYNDVRLPAREEWVMAASVEGKQSPYPWNGTSPRKTEGVLMANYMLNPEDAALQDTILARDLTAPVNSYFPNDFGLYNMSGNVAEMVYNDIQTKAAGTAGGGWKSTADEIKILGKDQYEGIIEASPCIGFRVVMTVK